VLLPSHPNPPSPRRENNPLMNYTHTQHTTTHTPKLRTVSVPVNTTPTKHQHQHQPPENTCRRGQRPTSGSCPLPVRVSLSPLSLPQLNAPQRNPTHSPQLSATHSPQLSATQTTPLISLNPTQPFQQHPSKTSPNPATPASQRYLVKPTQSAPATPNKPNLQGKRKKSAPKKN